MSRRVALSALFLASGCYVGVDMGGQDAATTGGSGTTGATSSTTSTSGTTSGATSGAFCTPAAVNFGDVLIGTQPAPTQQVICTNTGASSVLLSVDATNTEAAFSVTDANGPVSLSNAQTLAPSASYAFTVAFTPTATGTFNSSVDYTVCANATTCVAPTAIPLSGEVATLKNCPCLSGEACLSPGDGGGGCLGVEPDGGLCPDWGPSGACEGDTLCACEDGTTSEINPSNNPECSGGPPSCEAACCGHGGPSDSGILCGQLEISPNPISYVDVSAGQMANQVITIANVGTCPVSISCLSLDSVGSGAADGGCGQSSSSFAFSGVPSLPDTLAPDAGLSFTLTYSPSGVAADADQLDVFYATPETTFEATDPIIGDEPAAPCTLSIVPTTLDFGSVTTGTPVTRSATLTNDGQTTCNISAVSLAPSSDPSFTLDPSQATSFSILPAASALITVDFNLNNSSTPDQRQGTVDFTSNDPNLANGTIPLLASLCAAGQACTPTNVCDLGVTSCSTGTQTCTDTGPSSAAFGMQCDGGEICLDGGLCALPP